MMQPIRIIMKEYIPARLVQAKDRWYIQFYQTNPATGKRDRHRSTFDLGRIPIKDRLKVAHQQIDEINARLPYGYPYDQDFYVRTVKTTAEQAFEIVRAAGSDLRKASQYSYAYSMRKFEAYLREIGMIHLPIESVNRQVAMGFSDYLIRQGLSGRSHNNDINDMKRFFNVLKDRDILDHNPFEKIKKRKVEKKARKVIDDDTAVVIIRYLFKADVSVYLSCCLLYYCFIRPNEQRFIQVRDIDLQRNLIFIHGKYAKNRKDSTVTIPEQFRDILIALEIDKMSPDLYVLGPESYLGRSTPISNSRIGARYRAIIRDMRANNIIRDITGNTLYSWKDTGATRLAKSGINAIQLRDQLRHHSLEEMQTYIDASKGSDEFIRKNHRL